MDQQQPANQQPHTKYKTILCKHWTQTQTCSRGDSCHFAHGEQELRQETDNQPAEEKNPQQANLILQQNWNSGLPHNYKSVLCRDFSKGGCKFGDNCNYAHGQNELRKKLSYLQTIFSVNKGIQQCKQFLSQGQLYKCKEHLENLIFEEKHNMSKQQNLKLQEIQSEYTAIQELNQSNGVFFPIQACNLRLDFNLIANKIPPQQMLMYQQQLQQQIQQGQQLQQQKQEQEQC
ncbi:hypothetical protein PPERSA_12559 [Pseudocohnilembus persalinus]|uniref:C3H1-type domain-containing protein n=1 Tax=Pseudocohnilembus persalinus TaxID=266149 RepID=A0A0V0QCM8_PSEPJ|nr:hypothetical protein PPERSA_12559 [Pseudocohnilembus persalinus]|eukprot:KRW99883.1 hypothetical protein PPERSA_12559 [Pseudocohnilembus persalinus]